MLYDIFAYIGAMTSICFVVLIVLWIFVWRKSETKDVIIEVKAKDLPRVLKVLNEKS